eukprot:3322708-Amphidinium_carterae.1
MGLRSPALTAPALGNCKSKRSRREAHHHTARQLSYLNRRAPPAYPGNPASRSRLGPRLAPGLTRASTS